MPTSWDNDRDPLNTLIVTRRGYIVIASVATLLLLIALAIVGGIEQLPKGD